MYNTYSLTNLFKLRFLYLFSKGFDMDYGNYEKKVILDLTLENELKNYEIYFFYNSFKIVEQIKLSSTKLLVIYFDVN